MKVVEVLPSSGPNRRLRGLVFYDYLFLCDKPVHPHKIVYSSREVLAVGDEVDWGCWACRYDEECDARDAV